MIRKIMRHVLVTVLGGSMVLFMAVAPLTATVNAAAQQDQQQQDRQQQDQQQQDRHHQDREHHDRHDWSHDRPEVTTRSYNMDEYLDMLLATGQYAKYERFVQIASPEAYAQHLTWYNGWVNGYDPNGAAVIYVVIDQAANLGFDPDHDTFTLVGQNGNTAWVKVRHGYGDYFVVLQPTVGGVWHVAHVDEVH